MSADQSTSAPDASYTYADGPDDISSKLLFGP
jgi:hypothetical protein